MQPAALAARGIGVCTLQQWQHVQFTSVCMAQGSTLYAIQSRGVQLGAKHTPLEAHATLVVFMKLIFG
jgi:hypothetical protein